MRKHKSKWNQSPIFQHAKIARWIRFNCGYGADERSILQFYLAADEFVNEQSSWNLTGLSTQDKTSKMFGACSVSHAIEANQMATLVKSPCFYRQRTTLSFERHPWSETIFNFRPQQNDHFSIEPVRLNDSSDLKQAVGHGRLSRRRCRRLSTRRYGRQQHQQVLGSPGRCALDDQ